MPQPLSCPLTYPRGCLSSSLRTVCSQNSNTKWSRLFLLNTSSRLTKFTCFSCCNTNRTRTVSTLHSPTSDRMIVQLNLQKMDVTSCFLLHTDVIAFTSLFSYQHHLLLSIISYHKFFCMTHFMHKTIQSALHQIKALQQGAEKALKICKRI